MINILDKSNRKSKDIFILSRFFSENHAFNEIIWKNMVQLERPYVHRKDVLCVPGNTGKNTDTLS
jgi:hypothetical protein